MRVTITDAKQRLSKLVDSATKGAEVLILRNGKPVAKLVPVRTPKGPGLRNFGILKGRYDEAAIDAAFTPEVDAEIARMFDGDLDL